MEGTLRRGSPNVMSVVPATEAKSWEDLIPDPLRNAAYRSGLEFAWPTGHALEVIDVLERHNRRILGVDVWIPTQPGPTPVIYDWSEDNAGTAPNFPSTPSAFIRAFSWDLVGLENQTAEPHFNLTVV